MRSEKWTTADLRHVFRFDERGKSLTSIFGAEERGEIPKASRVMRGKVNVRQWDVSEIPQIGRRLGFLPKVAEQEVICIYTAKGGVLKSSLAFFLGRMCALNGLKTILIGLDIQCSVTDLAMPVVPVQDINEVSDRGPEGIFQNFFCGSPMSRVVSPTEIPTFSIIPENPELNDLERRMRMEKKQEYLFRDKLLPHLKDYDVVIFDNGPSWNLLVENSLVVATTVVSPAGCDLGTYRALKTNLSRIHNFQDVMELSWSNFLIVPTLLEKTNISQQIYGAYLSQYKDRVLAAPIRRAVRGQEAHIMQKSVMEYHPKSHLASDYYEMLCGLWARVLAGQGQTEAA